MELLYASCVGVLVSCGVFLILRSRTFPVVLGLTMFSYAVNLFLFSAGRLSLNKAAVLGYSSEYADPLPQALVLTAIVIGFAMTAFVVILAIRGQADLGNDHVDGQVPDINSDEINDNDKKGNV
ncbi:MAG: Na+/H+ antiporter subunit C [Colwellia sp.]|nr:Na+/H+ antiporter subunit C [Colwellia sp.]